MTHTASVLYCDLLPWSKPQVKRGNSNKLKDIYGIEVKSTK